VELCSVYLAFCVWLLSFATVHILKVHSSMLWQVLGPWHFWGVKKDPRLQLKTRPPDLRPLVSPCLIVSRLAEHLRNFQLLN
jgi:hypothetical protein